MGTQVSVKAGCCTWTSTKVGLCTTLGHGTMRKTHTYHNANFQRCKALTGAEFFSGSFSNSWLLLGSFWVFFLQFLCENAMTYVGDWENEITLSLSLALPEGAPVHSASSHHSPCLATI